jgi:hypothetical protein
LCVGHFFGNLRFKREQDDFFSERKERKNRFEKYKYDTMQAQWLEFVKQIQSWGQAFREGFLEEIVPDLGLESLKLEKVLRRTWLGEGIFGKKSNAGVRLVKHGWESCVVVATWLSDRREEGLRDEVIEIIPIMDGDQGGK